MFDNIDKIYLNNTFIVTRTCLLISSIVVYQSRIFKITYCLKIKEQI